MAAALTRDIITFLSDLAEEENMRVTIFESVKGGVIAGAGAAAGGVILGPVGAVTGGALGGLLAAGTCQNFKSVVEIIKEMPEHKKELLASQVRSIMDRHSATTVVALTAMAAGRGTAVRDEVMEEFTRFLRNDMQLSLA